MASFLDRVVVGLDKGVNSVKEGSKTMVERARLNTRISDLEKNKARTMMNIGKAIYELHTNNELRVEQCEAMCDSIDGMNTELTGLRERLRALEPEHSEAENNEEAYFEDAYRVERPKPQRSRSGGSILGKIANVAVIGLLSILTLLYLMQMFGNAAGNREAFEFIGGSAAATGSVLFWGSGIAMIVSCIASVVMFIISRRPEKTLLICGGTLLIEGIVLTVFCSIYSKPDMINQMPLALYRAFGPYASLTGMTIFIAIVMLVIGAIAAIRNR